jgi:hypothetical protein
MSSRYARDCKRGEGATFRMNSERFTPEGERRAGLYILNATQQFWEVVYRRDQGGDMDMSPQEALA